MLLQLFSLEQQGFLLRLAWIMLIVKRAMKKSVSHTVSFQASQHMKGNLHTLPHGGYIGCSTFEAVPLMSACAPSRG